MSKWTAESLATLRRLWDQEYTANQIGEEIGMSRNAVLGQAHRLGLKARVNPIMTRDQIFSRVVDRITDDGMTLPEAAAAESMPRMTALKMWNDLVARMGPTAI